MTLLGIFALALAVVACVATAVLRQEIFELEKRISTLEKHEAGNL